MLVLKFWFLFVIIFLSTLTFGLQTQVVSKFPGVVWGLDFKSKTEMFVTLRSGQLYYYNLKTKKQKKLSAPKVYASGQGGLLDVKFINSFLYVTYSLKRNNTATTALARAKVLGSELGPWNELFVAKVKGGHDVHFGSRLAFDGGHLFMSVGDRGKRNYAQDLDYHNGKILRLTLLGKPVQGNPFIGKKGLNEIWSYGHRNPQGIIFVESNLYSIEFGPKGGDELNLILKGKNYGWPIVTYGREYWGGKIGQPVQKGMEPPLLHWTPSISPSGLAYVKPLTIAGWKEPSLLLACLGEKQLRRVILGTSHPQGQQALFKSLRERIRHVTLSPDNKIYFSTDSGFIYSVEG